MQLILCFQAAVFLCLESHVLSAMIPKRKYVQTNLDAPVPAPASFLSYEELTTPLKCGMSPLTDTDKEAANYDPQEFANLVSIYGSALLAKKDRNVFGICPWRVEITDDQNNFLCDGVNIHARHILTVSSCLGGLPLNKIRIRYGDWDLLNNLNPREAYQNFDTSVCQSRPIVSTASVPLSCAKVNESGQLVLLQVDTIPDSGQYPQVKPICLPRFFENLNPQATPISSFDTIDSPCWIAGYNASPLTQLQNEPSIIPRIAQMKRVRSESRSQAEDKCHAEIEEAWVGINGYDACVGDIGTPILCYVFDEAVDDASSSTSSGQPTPGSMRPLKLAPAQPVSDKWRAVVVGIVKKTAPFCTIYDLKRPLNQIESQPLLASRVSPEVVQTIRSFFNQGATGCPQAKYTN